MVDRIGHSIVKLMDPVLGGLLHLPTDAALLILALATSLLIALVRRWTTDQDLLRRVAADKRTLRRLAREARARGDAPLARRCRDNLAYITWQTLAPTMAGEGRTVLVLLLPLALIGTWCFHRLEYHPLRAGDSVRLVLLTPAKEIEAIVHLAPRSGVRCHSTWAQQVLLDSSSNQPPRGIAQWQLTLDPAPQPQELTLRSGPYTLIHPMLVGGTHYLPPHLDQRGYSTRIELRPVKLFGLLPGIPSLGLPPWTVAYLLLAILGMLLLRRLLGWL